LPLLNRATIFNRLKIEEDKIPQWIGGVFILGWLIVFLRNFYFYSFIVSTIEEFLVAERTIGEYSYTLESILVFIFVLFLSGFIAKMIAILADNTSIHLNLPGEKKGGIRNWVLMIRIAIITVGILLAFAAAGIPMDRLTIIIGSLSVGIGFGLQDIVNNFISGIILAVERPVEIGDQIEIDEKTGKIKEIGIRSSKVVNFDGAEGDHSEW
jgi:small-conductance mechanosensitive channel